MRAYHANKMFEGKTDLMEKWYSVQYKQERIGEEKLKVSLSPCFISPTTPYYPFLTTPPPPSLSLQSL